MPIYSGSNSKLGIAAFDSAWGTKTVALDALFSITSESLKVMKDKKEEDALVGAKTSGRVDTMGEKVEGDVSGLVKANEIGWWLAATLGEEADAADAGSTSTVYNHAFTPIAGGSAATLPKMTIVVDRGIKTFAYVSCKVATMKLDAAVQDYLRATFTLRGHSEVESTSVTWPSRSTLESFKFLNGTATVDGSSFVDLQSFSLNYDNQLEDNLYAMDGSVYMQEIEPQQRKITADLDCLLSSTTEALRANNFLADTVCSVVLYFETDTTAGEGMKYRLTISIPKAYIMEDPAFNITGPERLKMKLSLLATEQGGEEAITITLRDLQATKYTA